MKIHLTYNQFIKLNLSTMKIILFCIVICIPKSYMSNV